MADGIQQSIAVKIRATVEGLASVQALSASVRGLNRSNVSPRISSEFRSINTSAALANKSVSNIGQGFLLLGQKLMGGSKAIKQISDDVRAAAKQFRDLEVGRSLLPSARRDVLPLPSSRGVKQILDPVADRQSASPLEALLARKSPFSNEYNQSFAKTGNSIKLFNAEVDRTTVKQKLFNVEAANVTRQFLGVQVSASGAAGVLLNVVAAATQLAAVLATVATAVAAIGFVKFVAEGIRFNGEIERAKIGLASILATTQDIRDENGNLLDGMDAFTGASEIAAEGVLKIQKAAITTAFKFEEILRFVTSATASLAGTNIGLDKAIDLTVTLSRAASAVNIPAERFNTQLKQLLAGSTTVRTDLAIALFGGQKARETNDQIKAFRQAGTLYEELTKRARIFALTQDIVAQSFAALSSNVADAVSQFAADSTVELFNNVKVVLGSIISSIIDLKSETVKLTPTFQIFADIINDITGLIGEGIVSAWKSFLGFLQDAADYIADNRDAIDQLITGLIVVAEQMAGIAFDLFSIVGDLFSATDETISWGAAMQYIALTIGLIRDILNIIIGSVETVIGLVAIGLVSSVQLVADKLSDGVDSLLQMIGLLDEAAVKQRDLDRNSAFNAFNNGAAGLLENGLNRTSSGLSAEAFNGAFDSLNRPITRNRRPQPKKSRFTSTPRSRNPNEDDEAGKAKREAEQQAKTYRSLLDALEDTLIAYKKKELEIEKDNNKLISEELQNRFDRGLVSAAEFYGKQDELRAKDLNAEEKFIKAKTAASDAKVRRQVASIFGQTDFSPEEYDQLITRLISSAKNGDTFKVNPLNKIDNEALKIYQEYEQELVDSEIELAKIANERKRLARETTVEIEKQARINKQQAVDIEAEFLSATESDGIAGVLNLQKRISDELPKILSESEKSSDAIKNAAKAISDAGAVEIDSLPEIFALAGVEVDSLSDKTKAYIKLIERLTLLSTVSQISANVNLTNSRLSEDSDVINEQVDRGGISRAEGRAQIGVKQREAVAELRLQLDALNEYITKLESKGIVTDTERRLAEGIKRQIANTSNAGAFESLEAETQDSLARIANRRAELELQFAQDKITELALRDQILAVEREEKIVLEGLIASLEKLPNLTIAQKQALAELKTEVGGLATASDTFAIAINEQIGGAIGSFLDSLVDKPGEILQNFRTLFAGLLLGFAKVILQAVVLKAILSALGIGAGSGGGGFGGILSGLLGISPVKKAEGGFISGAGTGISDSIPALLSHGEAMLPAKTVKAYGRSMIQSMINGTFVPRSRFASGGFTTPEPRDSSTNVNNKFRFINLLDPSFLKDYLSSAEGEQVVLNVVGKNSKQVNQMLYGS